MTQLAIILGSAGVVLLLVGLVGGGFTFSGSVMPTVGRTMRVFSFSVGGMLTGTALVLAIADWYEPPAPIIPPPPPPTSHAPIPPPTPTPSPKPAPSTEPASNTEPTTAVGVVMGDTAVPVYEYPSVMADMATYVDAGEWVTILCTAQGDVVTGDLGQQSSLWDGLSNGGFVPDVWIDTGSDQALAPQC